MTEQYAGAGSGGASTAYYISKFKSPCERVNITVYERSDYVGGRTTTVNVFDDPTEPVELGGSVFVEVNRNLVSAVKEFGLGIQGFDDGKNGKLKKSLGIYNGEEWVFRSSNSGWWDITKMLWKYGTAPIRTQRLMKKTVAAFLKVYEEPVFPFWNLTQTANEVALMGATGSTGVQYMNMNGIDSPFIQDIVQASTRVNYAQNVDKIHGLEAMVCMATDGAMQVRGGNWQIFDGMLRASGANVLLNTSVHFIFRQPNSTYTVDARNSSHLLPPRSYDTIILAAPYKYADLTISPPPRNSILTTDYVNLHVTLFTSPRPLDPSAFGLGSGEKVPTTVLTVPGNKPHKFFSISTIRLVTNPKTGREEYLYKIFSPASPDLAWLDYILLDDSMTTKDEMIGWIHRKLWQSYPYLPPRTTFEDIQLDDEGKVWYTSGIEGFISTMETSSLMGMNVAKLIVQGWQERKSEEGKMKVQGEGNMADFSKIPDTTDVPAIPKIPGLPPIADVSNNNDKDL